ncbi:P-loop containing nucleoside triphosphate hydrolase protein [Bisporella sp. PMI_857]|nr:P-loop containing nucleoside triphosphate hydrolase protein [Bisporella sp. PMI_857]
MATDRKKRNDDEYDVDFDDTRPFAFKRWQDAIASVQQSQSAADWEKITEERDWQAVHVDIQKRGSEREAAGVVKRLLNHIQPLPRSLNNLANAFTSSIHPNVPNFNIVWGLLHLNVKLSCISSDKLTRTADWMRKLRSATELFKRCFDACEGDKNEARYSMVDILEYLLQMLSESVIHLRRCPTDGEAARDWKNLDIKIKDNLMQMDIAIKHLSDINSYSKVNQERQVTNLAIRHTPMALPEERCTFPKVMVPRARNEEFFGRRDELAKINECLDYRDNKGLRTYTIYGRRGVGKTELALEYAHKNPSKIDAVFWIQCETSLSLRQSFTDMAVELNLENADRNGHHEENQLAVQRWLKTTRRYWLLIFDNAEREPILRGYWPVGANGAILITSRKYYNFMNDAERKGDTVKPFNEKDGWDLLMKLLGPEWQDLDRRGLLKHSEEVAAREFLNELGGLALAIQQAAQLIKNPNIGGITIASTYELFREHKKNLPERLTGERSVIFHALDSVWNMTFTNLSRNARDLLSVLSLLAPDGILIDLFLPKNQRALDGKLHFCKQHPDLVDPTSQATLSSVVRPPAALQDTIAELLKFKLIKQEGRELYAHREVQEAMNYHSAKEMQEYFHSASAVVYEAFPKQNYGGYLSKEQKGACQAYISHGAHLGRKYAEIRRSGTALKGSDQFIELLAHCAWYLYEISDYDICIGVINTGWTACENYESLQYATLCNIAGSAYYELNKLADCRKNWEIFFRIQENLLPEHDLERSTAYHNMGNLEYADDNLDEAIEYFEKAITLRSNAGDSAASLLANSYLCYSRVHYRRGEYRKSWGILGESEALFFRTKGPDDHFMAHVHYAYGNVDFAEKRWNEAKRSYDTSLRIALATAPIHPITAAAYYSLGCVEYERGNRDNAK